MFSFLDDRSLVVHENDEVSSRVNLGAGTPQGSCLSPILYLIYVNDMPAGLNRQNRLNSQGSCNNWQVILNPSKSKIAVFTRCPRHKAGDPVVLRFFGKLIPSRTRAEFLGATSNHWLTWEPQKNGQYCTVADEERPVKRM